MNLDLDEVCRICLRVADPKLPIFMSRYDGDRLDMTIASKIMSFAHVKVVEGDGLPANLCVECYYRVDTYFQLRDLCERSYYMLTEKLEALKGKSNDDSNGYVTFQISTQKRKASRSGILTPSSSDGEKHSKAAMMEAMEFESDLSKPFSCKEDKVFKHVNNSFTNPQDNALFDSSLAKEFVNLCNMSHLMVSDGNTSWHQHSAFVVPCKKGILTSNNVARLSKEYFELNFEPALLENGSSAYKCLICEEFEISINECFLHVRRAFHNAMSGMTDSPKHTSLLTSEVNNSRFKIKQGSHSEDLSEMNEINLSAISLAECKISEDESGVADGDSKYNCPFCSFASKHHTGFKIHMVRKHYKEISYPCKLCVDRKFPSKNDLKAHMTKIHGRLSFTTSDISSAKLELSSKKKEDHRQYECRLCNAMYDTAAECSSHVRQVHGALETSNINIKREGWSKSRKGARHLGHRVMTAVPSLNNFEVCLNPEGSSKLKCKYCKEFFDSEKSAYNHYYYVKKLQKPSNEGLRKYKCKDCNVRFSSRSTLMTHKNKSHKEKIGRNRLGKHNPNVMEPIVTLSVLPEPNPVSVEPEATTSTKQNDETEVSYRCDSCNKIFRNKEIHAHHVSRCGSLKTLSCTYCNKKCKSEMMLTVHMKRMHNDKYKNSRLHCQFCSKFFYAEVKLKRHYQVFHKEHPFPALKKIKQTSSKNIPPTPLLSKNVTCSVCNEKMESLQLLQSHVESAHKEYKIRYECSECPETYDKRRGCYMHILKIHKVKNCKLKCNPVCVLISESNHGSSDSSEKYNCNVCHTEFLVYDSLKSHMLEEHQNENATNEIEPFRIKIEPVEMPKLSNGTVLDVICLSDDDDDDDDDDGGNTEELDVCNNSDEDGNVNDVSYNINVKTELNKMSGDLPEELISPPKPNYFCGICNTSFLMESELISHLSSQLHKDMRQLKMTKKR